MPSMRIFVATVYGGALDVAELSQPLCEQAGFQVNILEEPELEDLVNAPPDIALFCISTTGSGDFPGNFMRFADNMANQLPDLSHQRYGLIAMGDSSYDTFCGAGRKLDNVLQQCGAQRIGERLEIDASRTPMADDEALPWIESWLPIARESLQ
ncbi:nitric oxide synthase [Kushneria phosphatilytica]|uniref:Nitric oxide synthase n=1 Tax=Kushneria phosphatilytica TaxID=657387 RepID=A0A5C1A237_9GAMM|nr:flavodoxin domain-containing protein [Kushneria phosphatilytica]QEL11169.1 nitric oxide synthase [Kushneria phosphatilytica]